MAIKDEDRCPSCNGTGKLLVGFEHLVAGDRFSQSPVYSDCSQRLELAILVLERYRDGKGPFTPQDGGKVVETLMQYRPMVMSAPLPIAEQAGRFPGTARSPNLGLHRHETQFCVGQFVLIDGDPNMRGRVVGISIHAGGTDYKVSYFHNGCNYEPMFDEFRLVACTGDH